MHGHLFYFWTSSFFEASHYVSLFAFFWNSKEFETLEVLVDRSPSIWFPYGVSNNNKQSALGGAVGQTDEQTNSHRDLHSCFGWDGVLSVACLFNSNVVVSGQCVFQSRLWIMALCGFLVVDSISLFWTMFFNAGRK